MNEHVAAVVKTLIWPLTLGVVLFFYGDRLFTLLETRTVEIAGVVVGEPLHEKQQAAIDEIIQSIRADIETLKKAAGDTPETEEAATSALGGYEKLLDLTKERTMTWDKYGNLILVPQEDGSFLLKKPAFKK